MKIEQRYLYLDGLDASCSITADLFDGIEEGRKYSRSGLAKMLAASGQIISGAIGGLPPASMYIARMY